MNGQQHAVVRQPTFLPCNNGGKVFLCPQPVKKPESLNVIKSSTLRLYDLTTL